MGIASWAGGTSSSEMHEMYECVLVEEEKTRLLLSLFLSTLLNGLSRALCSDRLCSSQFVMRTRSGSRGTTPNLCRTRVENQLFASRRNERSTLRLVDVIRIEARKRIRLRRDPQTVARRWLEQGYGVRRKTLTHFPILFLSYCDPTDTFRMLA